MPTDNQKLGEFGEQRVIRDCDCPRCKRRRTLVQLPANFRCADVICDFCGYSAQVKTTSTTDIARIPNSLLGGAWGPQSARMAAGLYVPLFLVLVHGNRYAVFYLPSDFQTAAMFRPRQPLSANARRAGWRGFRYTLAAVRDRFVRLC